MFAFIIIYETIFIGLIIALFPPNSNLEPFLRFSFGAYIDLIFLVCFAPIWVIITCLIASRLLPVFTKLTTRLYNRKSTSFYRVTKTPKRFLKSYLWIAIFPTLLAISLSMELLPYPNIYGWIFREGLVGAWESQGIGIVLLLFFVFIPFAIFIFLIFWAFNASGIIIFKHKENTSEICIENLGSHFLSYFKGFVGISSLIIYTQIYLEQSAQSVYYQIFAIVLPLLSILIIIPGIYIFEILIQSSKKIKRVPKTIPDFTEKFFDFKNKTHQESN